MGEMWNFALFVSKYIHFDVCNSFLSKAFYRIHYPLYFTRALRGLGLVSRPRAEASAGTGRTELSSSHRGAHTLAGVSEKQTHVQESQSML